MRRWLLPVMLSLLSWPPMWAVDSSSKRPAWCQSGWECLPRAEIAADTEFHLDLQEQIIKYRTRARRVGWTFGPGIGVAGVVDADLDVHYVPAVGIFLTYGWRP